MTKLVERLISGRTAGPGLVAMPLLLALACGGDAPPPAMIAIDSAGVTIVTSNPMNSDAMCALSDEPTFLVGDNEDKEEQWFSRVIGLARLSDGSVAVTDDYSGEVRVFDRTGAHLRTMGRMGEGPGEFRSPWIMWALPGDTLWVGDYRPMRYLVFSPDGEWSRTVNLDPVYLNPTRDGGVLANGVSINVRDQRDRRRDFSTPDVRYVEAHAPDGRLIGVLARVPGRTFGQVSVGAPNYYLSPIFDATPSIDAKGHTIAIANGRDPEVRVMDEAFRLRRIIRWSDPVSQVTRAHVQVFKDAETRRSREDGEISPYEEANLSDERHVADVFPAVSGVQVGMDGRVWVWRYRKPGESEGARLMAFGTDGEFVCHLPSTMPDFRVWEFGADYVLGVHTDELGVQRVALYGLTLPAPAP